MKTPDIDPMISLFNALAARLAEQIGEDMTPAMAEVARKFLHDNNINCDLTKAESDSAAGELANRAMPFRVLDPVDEEDTEAFG